MDSILDVLHGEACDEVDSEPGAEVVRGDLPRLVLHHPVLHHNRPSVSEPEAFSAPNRTHGQNRRRESPEHTDRTHGQPRTDSPESMQTELAAES